VIPANAREGQVEFAVEHVKRENDVLQRERQELGTERCVDE
jgi:hypothetical protein